MGKNQRKRHGHSLSAMKQELKSAFIEPRMQSEIIDDLSSLATSPGYIHALAMLVFTSNTIKGGEEFTTADFAAIYDNKRLIRTELNILIGLMLGQVPDLSLPNPNDTQRYIDRSQQLLEELHQSLLSEGHAVFSAALSEMAKGGSEVTNPLGTGAMLREAIFYGGESAFAFQYEELARQRYATDRSWLLENVGFDIDEAADVIKAVRLTVAANYNTQMELMRKQSPAEWTMLPIFTFDLDQIVRETSLDCAKAKIILEKFSICGGDKDIKIDSMFSYNKSATHPFVKIGDNVYISFLEYSAFSALYENPFYWIASDKKYMGQHSQSRGSFVEEFTERMLLKVFPEKHVHRNIIFRDNAGKAVGEADAILFYGYRAFIVQAKSKRLTLASWNGDDNAIASDFQAAVQHAYDQAIDCVRHLQNGVTAYVDGVALDVGAHGPFREFYPICITSEHYPALSMQSSVLLQQAAEPQVYPAIVTDIFTLDIIVEMLDTPLYFTDYLAKRAKVGNRLHVSHELVALGWYIKNNIYIKENSMYVLADDVMVDLDLAVLVRRQGLPGKALPDGQLNRFDDTPIAPILDFIKVSERPDIQRLGEVLLSMSAETSAELSRGISQARSMTMRDLGRHDISICLEGGGGITVHCNAARSKEAAASLTAHCNMRKYVEKADAWYGVAVGLDGDPMFMTGLEFPWQYDAELEADSGPLRLSRITHALHGSRKIGRNHLCPCGSGRKYKRCCLN